MSYRTSTLSNSEVSNARGQQSEISLPPWYLFAVRTAQLVLEKRARQTSRHSVVSAHFCIALLSNCFRHSAALVLTYHASTASVRFHVKHLMETLCRSGQGVTEAFPFNIFGTVHVTTFAVFVIVPLDSLKHNSQRASWRNCALELVSRAVLFVS